MTSPSLSSFYPKPSSYATPTSDETPETDKTSPQTTSNDLTQCIILPEFPTKTDIQLLNPNHSTLRTQTPIPPFYSKKIIPNPLHNHFKSTRIPSTPKPQNQSTISYKTPIRDHLPPSHVCIAYKDKPKQTIANDVYAHNKPMFNTTQFVISHSNLEVVGNSERVVKRKVLQRRMNVTTTGEVSDVGGNEKERKIIKITDSLKEEVVAKQQRKGHYHNDEVGMMLCGNNNSNSHSINVNNVINKEKIVKLKSNSTYNRCNNNNKTMNSINTKLCYNRYIKPTSNVSSPSSNHNYFYTQTHNTINNDMIKVNKTIQTHCDNSFNNNNNNITNNEAMLQYSYSTPPFEQNHFLNNTTHSIISTNSNNFNTSIPYHRYNTLNSHSPVNTTTTTIHNNPIIICKPSPKHTQYDSQYHSNHSVSSMNHTISNLNQSYPINIYHPQTPIHQLPSNNNNNNTANRVIDSYIKKTLNYTNHKSNGLSYHRKNINSNNNAKHNSSLVKHIHKIKKPPQQQQQQQIHSQSFRTSDKKKKYIHKHNNNSNNKVNEVPTTSRSPCSATKNTNSFLIKNKHRTKQHSEPKGTKQVVKTERKGMKTYGRFCDNNNNNVKKHKKEDNVFLKLYSQIYLQLTQDK